MLNTNRITKYIKEKAKQVGFDLVSISPVHGFPENQLFKEWLGRGYAGEMGYMSRNSDKRTDITQVLPGAKSVICCALNYNTDFPYSVKFSDGSRGWISRYAWSEDYHELIGGMLKEVTGSFDNIIPEPFSSKYYVDTGPVLEKVFSKYAGIGWIGKNTCLINQELGSWLFLGEIIVDFELDYDLPVKDRCGSCTKCIESCPTGAIVDPYVLDASECISYLTIELKGVVPTEFRENMKNNIYGCDICQDVCPWNRRAAVTDNDHFTPHDELFNPLLSDIMELTFNDFSRFFKNSPIKRAKKRGMLRNILIAMGNSSNKEFLPYLITALHDEEPVVRASAIWAYWKICGDEARGGLVSLLEKEDNALVRDEILNILE